MNFVVTGSNGFIGSKLVPKLRELGHKVVSIDNMEYASESSFEPSIKRSISELTKEVFHLIPKGTLLIHLAAVSSLPECEANPSKALQYNVSSTAHIIDLLKDKLSGIIFASSNSIFENRPNLIYPLTKIAAEEVVDRYAELYNIPAIIARFSNVYGMVGNQANRKFPSLVGYLLNSIHGDYIPILYNNTDVKRNYVYVTDVVNALIKDTENITNTISYKNYYGNSNLSVPEIIEGINNVFNCDIKPIFKEPQKMWDMYEELKDFPSDRLLEEVFKDTENDDETDIEIKYNFSDGLLDIKQNGFYD